MMKQFRAKWFLAAAIPAFASAALANPVSMAFTGVGDGVLVGNAYVDPYTALVNGTNELVLCDDWSNNTFFGETWTANEINLSTVGNSALGTPMFGNNQSLYNELAWLGSQMLAKPTDPYTQKTVSFAIWELTYGQNGTYEENPGPALFLSGTPDAGLAPDVAGLLNQATTLHSDYNGAGWEILTPIPGSSHPAGDGIPQEFLMYTGNVPEPGSFGAMAIALAGLLWIRKRGVSAK